MERLFDNTVITVELKDGSTITYSFRDANAVFSSYLENEEDMTYGYRLFNRFDRIIDPDDVVSVMLCGVTIPMG